MPGNEYEVCYLSRLRSQSIYWKALQVKAIFLDIDGVLNNRASFARDKCTLSIDPACVDQLERITKACPDAKVVLSSTWRLFQDHTDFAIAKLAERGIRIVASTPDLRGEHIRGQEIAQFKQFAHHVNIAEFPLPISRFVILDDDSDMLDWQKPFFVQTNFVDGLTRELADKAIEILAS